MNWAEQKKFRYMGKLCHVITITKDGNTELLLYKQWNKYKQRWEYKVGEVWLIELHAEPAK